MKNKPKILLCVDKPKWAYDQMADFLIDELGDKYCFHKLIAGFHLKPELQGKGYKIKTPLRWLKSVLYESYKDKQEYDILVYMWWHIPDLINLNFKAKRELRGIFTESFPPGRTVDFNGDEREFVNTFIKPADGIVAGSQNILQFYQGLDLPVYYATGSTDTRLFRYNRKQRDPSVLRVCWTGNPDRNFKGFYDFVEPAVQLARQRRPGVELVTRFSGPLDTLPAFYADVDIMVNASIGDAGPGFIIDAGGCGVPSISTDVGFASEIIQDRINGMLVERDIDKIADKIVEVYDQPALLKTMSNNIAQEIANNWGRKSRAKYWDAMFEKVLEESK